MIIKYSKSKLQTNSFMFLNIPNISKTDMLKQSKGISPLNKDYKWHTRVRWPVRYNTPNMFSPHKDNFVMLQSLKRCFYPWSTTGTKCQQ